MYYKIDLNNYEPREVVNHLIINDYEELTSSQRQLINYELVNFQDSFGKPWKEFTINELSYRLSSNWTFFLIDDLEIKGWAFIDYNWEIPYLCNRYVVPQHRDGKLGDDLVWMRLNYLKKQGYDNCYGFIDNWNKPAQIVSRKVKKFTKIYDESLDIKKK